MRGETVEEALKAGSAFRQLVDGLDPTLGVVTLWVYPDSFALYRRLGFSRVKQTDTHDHMECGVPEETERGETTGP